MFNSPSESIQIKKYPNRRYYDATHSRHVTLQEVHDLIMAGHDVSITDSRNGDDITNLVLTQILLERDQPKLDLFPSSILHVMIRSNRQMLRAWLDNFFGPFLGLVSSSQKQWDSYLRTAMHGKFLSPMDWASGIMGNFAQSRRHGPSDNSPPNSDPLSDDGPMEPPPATDELDELRRQVAGLKARIDQLNGSRETTGPSS